MYSLPLVDIVNAPVIGLNLRRLCVEYFRIGLNSVDQGRINGRFGVDQLHADIVGPIRLAEGVLVRVVSRRLGVGMLSQLVIVEFLLVHVDCLTEPTRPRILVYLLSILFV